MKRVLIFVFCFILSISTILFTGCNCKSCKDDNTPQAPTSSNWE